MSETEKKKKCSWKITEEILDYNKNAQKNFPLASKVNKRKSVLKKTIVERNTEESVQLRRTRIAEIEQEEKKHKQWIF